MNAQGQPRFIVVTGKGGVGKTLVSMLNGLQASRMGLKTLICELNTTDSVAQQFGTVESNGNLVEVSKDLWLVNIRPDLALMEYANLKLGVPSVSKLVFSNPIVRALTDFVPGMSDLLMLGKAFNHQREMDQNNQWVWDLVIIDAPATGHGLTFLNLPSIISSAIPTGNMHTEAIQMHELLSDEARTRIDVVTIPEVIPIQETIDLHRQLVRNSGFQIGRLVVNRCPTPLLTDMQWEMVDGLQTHEDELIHWLLDEERYRRSTDERLLPLQELGVPTITLPDLPSLSKRRATSDEIERLLSHHVAHVR